ncbi:UDP-3-O-glucosamine N-acyltransferase [Trametes coccinea BRFM310]|uniref:Translation initiation factor eIF2B subunit gamma n=1 Tax=Trametes coccinea (strain BRFM310) TaxID=1353009 RepID=A0A1Y2J2E5_TRAC3|nr:UDP-3-O-glucosamine N-acyltransferase [Trametes coccinea BRFM310]
MDFDESSTTKIVTREFLAVILAGFGNELLPLTSNHGDDPCPKALLPIANKPMVEYPLAWLEQSGITDVLLICPASHRSAMSNYIQSDISSNYPSLRIDLQTCEESQDMAPGTCTVLRQFSSRIQSDFVLLPCDFVPPPSLSLTQLLNKFRTESTYDGAIATACFYEAGKPDKGTVTEDWGMIPTNLPIVFDERSGTLLHIDSPDDVDNNSNEFELRMSLLSQYPRTKLSASFRDSHVYVCRRSVLDALNAKPHFDSIKEEFIPWLCKPQYQRTRREKYGSILSPVTNNLSQALALKHSTLHLPTPQKQRLRRSAAGSEADDEHLRSVVPSPVEEDDEESVEPSLRVGLVAHRASSGFASRANNLHAYLELNRFFLGQTTWVLPSDPKDRTLIDQKAQISSDSMIGRSTRVEERASIKRSVIGKHCVIGKMAKVVGCVLLDHCVVADGAKLDGCILGTYTKVGAKAELSRCVTQPGYEVGEGETARNEKLETSDWTARDTSESQDSDESEDASEDSSE